MVYLFGAFENDQQSTLDKDLNASSCVFRAYSSPTQNPPENEPHWFPYTEVDDRHYVIDVYPRLARDLVNSDVIEFWESLLTQDFK